MGAPAKESRTALGALIIKERLGITDEETVCQIRENPYLQYFLGLHEYPQHFIMMVLDGASLHKAKALSGPANIYLIPLPAYSPQINPQENVWDEIREKNFPNRVYSSMDAVRSQLATGLENFAAAPSKVTSLTA